jgi:DNA polymerase-3 subunit gamma/tau
MSYQVIARKWRPQSFEEVTGQEPITRTLKSAIEHERLHHAYLFSGARGVGKTTTARLLAKALNCHKATKPTPTPCRADDPTACASCREIAEGRSIDVLEIDAASNTGVDSVRDSIINNIGVRPARDRFKVFIIDEVHMLSGAAFNALLKTLEEPPAGVVFIMATTEAHKVPDTILSRCQQFEFRTIPTAKIAERLKLIAEAERISIDDAALREIARAGAGSMRDAQSAFDQTISFSFGEKITTETVENALGLASSEVLARTAQAIAETNAGEALKIVDELVARGHDLRNFCRDLLAYFRDLLVVKIAGVEAELTDTSEQERRALRQAGANFSETDLTRFFHSLTETEKTLRESLHPRYQLEIGLVKLVEMRRLAPLDSILARLSALEDALKNDGALPPANASNTPNASNAPRGGSANFTHGSNRKSAASEASAEAFNRAPSNAKASSSQIYSAPQTPSVAAQNFSSTPSDLPNFAASPTSDSAAPAKIEDDAAPPFEPLPPLNVSSGKPPLKLVASNAPLDLTNVSGAVNESLAPSFFDAPCEIGKSSESFSNANNAAASQTGSGSSDQFESAIQSGDLGLAARIRAALEEERKPLLAIAVESAREVGVDGEDVYIEFPTTAKHLRDTLTKPENMKIMQTICRTIFGRGMGLRIVVGRGERTGERNAIVENRAASLPRPIEKEIMAKQSHAPENHAPRASRASADDTAAAKPLVLTNNATTMNNDSSELDAETEMRLLRERAANHPRVKEALKIFGAEIIEVVKLDPPPTSN